MEIKNKEKRKMLKKKKYNIFDTLRICFFCNPKIFVIHIIFCGLVSLIPSMMISVNKNFIDGILEYAHMHTSIFRIVKYFILLSVFSVILNFQWIISNLLKEKIYLGLRSKFYPRVVERITRLKYEYIENGDTCDLFNRIINWPGLPTIEATYSHLMGVLSSTVYILGLSIALFNIKWWYVPVYVLCSTPLFIGTYCYSKEIYEKVRWTSIYARKSNYIEFDVLRGRELAAERTLFGFSGYFNEKFRELFMKTVNLEIAVRKKWLIINKIFNCLIIGTCVFLVYNSVKCLKMNTMTIGLFISIGTMLFQLEDILADKIPGFIDQLTSDNEYLKDFTIFMNLEEEIDDNEGSLFKEEIDKIEFRNVCFTYPGTSKEILKNVSFVIEKGKHYSLVGTNGSGKSTITKLLLGLYSVNKGEILINGKNIKQYNKKVLYDMFSIVYQDFVKYEISIKDNIGLGNREKIDNMEEIKKAAVLSGANEFIEGLDDKYETKLGKVYENGVDISGGEWQRLAIARSLMNYGVVRILDEPTSALDPIEESKLYKKYSEILNNNTTIFISHRLGSTKLADKIIVLDNGSLIDIGTHDELMNKCEMYRQMFNSQKEWYYEER